MDDELLIVRGIEKHVLNLSSFDFLGLSRHPSVKKISQLALDKYGCGSCGPRGFYGTIDKHISFEKAIATFMQTQEAISYSDSASAISSAIPAFAKKGDLLIVDEACSEPIRTGLNLSRATVQTFKHNDMTDLSNILQSIMDDDIRFNRETKQQRRFIVTEGLFRATGDICNLPEILKLKEVYFYRLILDESLSFGTLGTTGRGVTEHFGRQIDEAEIVLIAMDTSMASVGGICIGSREIVDHQRLSGAGYCFSAAGPPFLSASATESLSLMTPHLLKSLHSNSHELYLALNKISEFRIRSKDVTPIIHLVLSESAFPNLPALSKVSEYAIIISTTMKCIELGTGISACKFGLTSDISPSLRICTTAQLSRQQIDQTVTNLSHAIKAVISNIKGDISLLGSAESFDSLR